MVKNTEMMKLENILIYRSWFTLMDKLTDEQAGKLIKRIGNWGDDNSTPCDDLIVEGIFMGLEENLERLSQSYEKKVKANRENGKKGGRPSKTQKNPMGLKKPNITEPNPKNLKDKEKEKEKDKEKDKEMDKENAMHAVTSNAMQIMEFSSLEFGKLNHKQKYEYLKLLKSGVPIVVDDEKITIKDFCLIQEIPYDDEEYELDKEMSSIFN